MRRTTRYLSNLALNYIVQGQVPINIWSWQPASANAVPCQRKELCCLTWSKASKGSRDSLLNICKVYHELNEHEHTELHLQEALGLHPEDVEFNVLFGRFMLNMGSIDKAILAFNSVLEIEPAQVDVSIFLARAYRRCGKLSLLSKHWELQTVNNPENINLLTLLGNILAEAENWAACLDVWEKVKQINPNRPELVSKIANCL